MCDNVQRRVVINVDNKHILAQEHKEHSALADIINKNDKGWN